MSPILNSLLYISIPLPWLLAFVIVMGDARKLGVSRLPMVYCMVSRSILFVLEYIWYIGILQRIERDLWSRNAVRDNMLFNSYEEINKYPCLLFGYKRAVSLGISTVIFFCAGLIRQTHSWALWCGSLLLFECFWRSILIFCWFSLPNLVFSKTFLEKYRAGAIEWFRSYPGRIRTYRSSHERVSFREDLAEPFRESGSETWKAYMSLLRPLPSKQKK